MSPALEWFRSHGAALYLASEWIVRLAMLFYVPQWRTPAAARAWLLLVFLLPWPGLVLYLYIGRISLPQWRLDLQAKAAEFLRKADLEARHQATPRLPESYSPALDLAFRLGHFHPLHGNQVELIGDYNGMIDRLVADIDAATKHVHLEYYIFASDETGRRVAQAVIRAANRGVACRVLLDSVGAADGARTLGPDLRKAGVEVVLLLSASLWRRWAGRFDLRNHRKIVVIDGAIGYVGSQNIANPESHHAGYSNEELVARVRGPLVSQLQAVFLADRYGEIQSNVDGPDIFPPHQAEGQVDAQLVPSGPGYHRENTLLLILALLGAAKERVTITTPYLIPDEPLIRAMQSAVIRGVDVRVIVPRTLDQLFMSFAQKSFYGDLLEAGVRIHLYEPAFLHAKHISVDDEISLIGSSNVDIRSFALNAEISGIFYDRQITATLRKIQDRYLSRSAELRKEQWDRRPIHHKVFQNIARLADSIL